MRKRPDLAARNRARSNPDARTRHPLYRIWQSMIARCHNPAAKDFGRYGGRGIAVCSRWRESLEAFIADVGERPSRTHSLDRIDNDLGYEPGNVRWATPTEQTRNRRSNREIEHNGRTQTLAAWAAETGISRALISHRLRSGWSVADALTKRPDRSLNSRHRRGTKEVCT